MTDIFPQPKNPVTASEAQRQRARAWKRRDAQESEKVRVRSGGRCEMPTHARDTVARCTERATEVHHLIGGIGRRGRGDSALAKHKVHLCKAHHDAVESGILTKGGVILRSTLR
jgi:hypothetical protein